MKRDNLTAKQLDANGRSKYAVFLPALSTFYSTQIDSPGNVNRVPAKFENGLAGMNWLDADQGYFTYKWSLYSAGHAQLDLAKKGENMIRNRDRNDTFILADSGGFQIGKGVWEGDWTDPNDANCAKRRKQVLAWIDAIADYGMVLDIPPWICKNPEVVKKTGIKSYQHSVEATMFNNEYFIKNRNGGAKFLNVMQGMTVTDSDHWYSVMKKYCDPKQYPNDHFNGWSMGGQATCAPTLALRRIIMMRDDGLLEKGVHDWMHFLGTSKLEWALLLTDIQNAVRKTHNENFTISFDCASPFLATANGQIYTNNIFDDRKKWSYRMIPSVDDKKYAHDTRTLRDAVLQDGVFTKFEESPFSERMQINDVCKYGPGDLNKIGKEGRTSWDSFSYALQMGHNVWMHLQSVQEANRLYSTRESCPRMLVDERHDRKYLSDVVNEIFASDTGKAFELIKEHDRFLTGIIGSRGNKGKKETNANTCFNNLFSETGTTIEQHSDDSGFDETVLDKMDNGEE